MAEQRVVLEHEADLALASVRVGRVLAVEARRCPASGDFEPGDDPQQRRLAGPRRPEQREQFAGLDVEVDVVDGDEAAEALGDAA